MEKCVTLTCSCGCGQQFDRPLRKVNPGNNYVNVQHAGAHSTRLYLEDMCGDFVPLITGYLAFCERRGLKEIGKVRIGLAPFFLFLTENTLNLKNFKPSDVDAYLDWAENVDYQNARHDISVLKGFFAWVNQYGHHAGANPVIPKFHAQKRSLHLPRPYTEEEMYLIWKLADERGSAMVRAIVAIGEEAGLRNGEICRLRLGDIDLTSMTFFIRLPNKGDEERFAFFHEKTANRLNDWLLERSNDCDHDLLFHNTLGNPLTPATLHATCSRVFCRTYGGKLVHDVGMDRWSMHRLRHTMASNLASAGAPVTIIMAAGGWKSFSALAHYAKIHLAAARRDYDQAMQKVRVMENALTTVVILSTDEFLAEYGF